MKRKPPRLVCVLGTSHGAWVVGSAADPANKSPRDWDVIVPYTEWCKVAPLIRTLMGPNIELNTFGGFKCKSDGVEVDVWPDDMTRYMTNGYFKFAWHPLSGVRVSRS